MVGIMNKAKFETNDLSISNIKKISEIFPNCITEVKNKTGEIIPSINFELLRQMLTPHLIEGSECFEFTWAGKKSFYRRS